MAASTNELPSEVTLSEIKLDKVVLAAEAGGKKYFLGQDVDGKNTCLIAVPEDLTLWNAGCSEADQGELLRTSGPDQITAVLVADGYDTKELESAGWAKIQDNILVPKSKAGKSS